VSETETDPTTEPETETTEPVDDDPDQTEGTEDEAPEPTPEPEPEPEQPSDEDRAKLAKALDTRFTNYRNSVEKILADEVQDWLLCPLCVSGMAPGYVNRHDLGRVPEEVQANVQMYLGFQRETEYPEAKGINTCEGCNGLGKVSTGSRVAEHMTITCPSCKGYGYTPPPGFTTNQPANNGEAAQAISEALADLEVPERDNWGEPRILPDGTLNGNYGKMPQFKSVHPVYGVTANLSPEEIVAG
jgi:hypothetical protein